MTPVKPTDSQPRPLLQRALQSRIANLLAAPHSVDSYLQQLNPLWSVDQVRAEVVSVCSQTDDTVSLQLRPNRNWAGGIPGQFVRLTVSIDGRQHTRCFSPAQSQHATDGLIEITAKLPAEAFVTRHMRDGLSIGDVVTLSQAAGEFALPAKRPERILLISGGSGITPVMAMLRTLCDEKHPGRISFLHYNRSAADQLYAEELQQLADQHTNVELIRCYEEGNDGELQGRFSATQLQEAVTDFAQAETFLCGPAGLMQAVQTTFADAGRLDHLHQEAFTLAPLQTGSDSAEGEVRFARSERIAENSGESLLDQAEAAGLRPEAGCRMGICYSCTCRKSAGKVRDLRSGAVSDDGEADIQLCVSVPVGDVTLDL